MNYYDNNFYGGYSYGQRTPMTPPPNQVVPQPQQTMVPSTIPFNGLNGKIVDSEEVVRATEVPMGGYGVFPKADLSKVYIKSYIEQSGNMNPSDRSRQTRDAREGRSGMTRRTYMEGQAAHADKATQMKELEKYVQELGKDLTEMIKEASPEEKQILQQKISTLAQKVQ